MAKNKTVKNEGAAKETAAQVTTETAAAVAEKVEAVAEKVEAAAQTTEKVAEGVTAEVVAEKVAAVTAAATETVKAEAAKVEAAVTEATGQVASFVKGRLEQAQRQIGQLETEAQKALQTLVSRGRESSREVLQKLNVNELRLRENPAVQKLEKQATQVGGEVRQRLSGLRSRMVTVVGGVASQSQVDALNRELDRLSRKLDSLVSKKPEAQQPQQQQ
jgi:hypothetical protein